MIKDLVEPIGVAAAVAIAELIERTHALGSITVFGTPGEEMMPPAHHLRNKNRYLEGSVIVLPLFADSRAAVRISVTIMLFSSDDNPPGLRLPRATAMR